MGPGGPFVGPMDRESAERASVIRSLLRALHSVGIDPEEGFEAVFDGVNWSFVASESPGASSSLREVNEDASTIQANTAKPQKR